MMGDIGQSGHWDVAVRVRRVVIIAVALVVAIPHLAAGDDVLGSIRLPGGVAAARRVAELGEGPRQKTGLLTDLTRVLFAISSKPLPEARERFARYLDYLFQTERALADWPDGLALTPALAADRNQRDAFERLVRRLGLRLVSNRDRVTVEAGRSEEDLERQRWLQAARVDIRAVADGLNKGGRVRVVFASDDLPLPVPALWTATVFQGPRDPLVQLVSRPEALFTYLGLMELDRDTLAWIAGRPDVFRMLYENRAIAFGAFGRAVRVRDGVLATPGGASVVPIWEDLVGAPVTDPLKFLSSLFEKDDGRLAYFYAAASAANPNRQAFLLGARIVDRPGERDRARYVRDVRSWFVASNPTWSISLQPLLRPAIDPALAIAMLDVDESGAAGPAWWPLLFERIVSDDGWPERPQDTMGRLQERPLNSTWLLYFLFGRPDGAAERWTLFRFAQRRLRSVERSAAPDVEITLRALKDMPALVLSLERMGVTDPALFATVARAGRRLWLAGGPGDTRRGLRVWQGALATLEQVVRHRPIPEALLTKLLTSLAAAVGDRPLEPSGRVAGWILHDLLPALDAVLAESSEMETDAFRKLLAESTPSGPIFEWETVRYRVDTRGPAAASAVRLAAVMPGPRLHHLSALDQAAGRLSKPFSTLDELAAVVRAIEGVLSAWPQESLDEAARELRRIRAVKDLPKAARERTRVLAGIDAATAEIAPVFVYALAMSPTTEPPHLFAGGPASHVLALRGDTGRWESFAWRLGEVTRLEAGGTVIRGSFLGLDKARAAPHLSRLANGPNPVGELGGAIRDATLHRLADRAVLRAPPDWAQRGADVAAAIARGRARTGAWKTAPPAPTVLADELSRAGIDQARQNQLQWLFQQKDREAVDDFLPVTDLYRLGSPDELPVGWGQSGRALDGCWCVLGVGREPAERFRGYNTGYASAMVSDVSLRLAEILAEMKLPAAVIEPMLPFAIQDALDQAAQLRSDDWEPLTWGGRLTPARVEHYLQALQARRMLAAPDSPIFAEGRDR